MEVPQESKKRQREGPNSGIEEPAEKKVKVDSDPEPKIDEAVTLAQARKEAREKLATFLVELEINEEDVSKLDDERNPEEVFGLVKRSEVQTAPIRSALNKVLGPHEARVWGSSIV
jgi:hypothetical protein